VSVEDHYWLTVHKLTFEAHGVVLPARGLDITTSESARYQGKRYFVTGQLIGAGMLAGIVAEL
jgi:hypothetical protein